ncbi:hypothetical protein MPER_13114 [Moniliophthora perniciosa FA553]|nr:hypothetical protein MPER_13114 [Moniliophthora perniciosa FA553]
MGPETQNETLQASYATTAYINSKTEQAFIIKTNLFENDDNVPALIDSGASRLFLDREEAAKYTRKQRRLEKPVKLTLFDGESTSSGLITHALDGTITFEDGTVHKEELLITKLHPEAKLVLGLPWLRKYNPDIDWSELKLSFRNGVKLCASIIKNLDFMQQPQQKVEIEEEEELRPDYGVPLGVGEPLLLHESEWEEYEWQRNKEKLGKQKQEDESIWKDPRPPDQQDSPYISLIGAAPFMTLIQQGCEIYTLRIMPETEEKANLQSICTKTMDIVDGKPRLGSNDDVMTPEERADFEKHVPKAYHQFDKVFSDKEAQEMPPHRSYDMKIQTEEEQYPPPGKVYNMSGTELKALKEYIDDMLGKGFIRPSNSPIGAPVLFAKKKDGSLRLCVDFRALNKLTIKDRYTIPLIGNLIDQLKNAKVYTKLDLRAGYYNVRIAEGEEWKTAFRTRYGSFEYLVMPMGLSNAPSVFQRFMNDIFHDMVDICVIVYLDDILIYSDNEEEHERHVKEVFRRLEKNDLHLKLKKCEFHTKEVEYLGVIVTPNGVRMDPSKVKVIRDWPVPTNLKELQAFLGFANFYRRFIDNYSGIVKPLTTLTSKNKSWEWTKERQSVFELLKEAFGYCTYTETL